MGIIDKRQMSEEDIKLNFITPALMAKGWHGKIAMEKQITDGRVKLVRDMATREAPKRADYVLYLRSNYPLAVIEAKDNRREASFGLEQAKEYSLMLDAPFAYSSNGDAFREFDFITGKESDIPLDAFPTPDALFARYKKERFGKNEPSGKARAMIDEPYYSGQNTPPPRYYQQAAVNRAIEALSRGQRRVLLVMATGTGKTYTAFQIVWRLLKSGAKGKILYLADRNILVDQTISGDFAPLKNVTHKINFAKDSRAEITAYMVYFSLYQQLSGASADEEEEESGEEALDRYQRLFDRDFFDLVIVDECHRGSARADGLWRRILEYFASADQIGMTATPKETRYVSNIDYFGEPVYKYSLKEGISDGFLAPFKVIRVKTDIDDEWQPKKGQRDINGVEIENRIYNNSDYDYSIVIQDRTNKVAEEITEYLKARDRMAKTIVFCATEAAAERMRAALAELNADMLQENPDYVVRITGSDDYGKSKLDYFISVSAKWPVIATTSKLLSTGVDCKMVKLIVLDEMISSMTEFKQIIGRGTRLRWDEGKTHFVIMDFRGVTRLFADPEWDGPIEQVEGFAKEDAGGGGEKGDGGKKDGGGVITDSPGYKCIVDKSGCTVQIMQRLVSVYDTDGRLLRQESLVDYTKANIFGEFATLESFILQWSAEEKKAKIRQMFLERGIDLEEIKADEGMADVDDFDFICHIAFDKKPLTRRERAEGAKKSGVFAKYGKDAQAVLEALLDKYADSGIYEIENINVLKLDPFVKFGKPAKIAELFGGRDGYLQAVRELEREIYKTA